MSTFYWTRRGASKSRTLNYPGAPPLLSSERFEPNELRRLDGEVRFPFNHTTTCLLPAGQLRGAAEVPRVVVCQRDERHRGHHGAGKWQRGPRRLEPGAVRPPE